MKNAALVLLTLCVLATSPLVAKEESALDLALAAFKAGEYEKTLELLATVTAEDENRPRADYLKGETELMLGKPEEAAASFRAVLDKRPKAVPAMTGLARALLQEEKAADAVLVMRKAVMAAPKDAEAQRVLGEALAAVGKAKEAVKVLRKALKLDKKDPLTARALVEVLISREALPEALGTARSCAKALPDHPMGYFLSGLVLDRQGEDEKAIKAYESALEKDDEFLDAHKNLAILCHTINPLYRDKVRTKKALEHYEKYFDLGGEDAELEKLYKSLKWFIETQMGG